MSDHVDNEEAEFRSYGLKIGVVVDNADPLGLGRVRMRIPHYYEPMGPWAFPLGTAGGGGGTNTDGSPTKQGLHIVPKIGAEVGVFFKDGDPDMPYYLAGHYGIPSSGNETPTPVAALSASDTMKVAAFEFGRYLVVVDDREGHRGLIVQDKLSHDRIEHDGEKMSWAIKGTSLVLIQADGQITLDAPLITIGGRPVGPGPEQL